MAMAAETWTGEWWASGGGGTVWDSISFDPELGLVYIGTGNGSPWVRKYRSPGGGDNLFLASIVIVLAPFAEELFFRGFVYRALRNRLSTAQATGVVAVVFGSIHYSGPETMPLLPVLCCV